MPYEARPVSHHALSLRPVTADDTALLGAWFEGDADGLSHLSSYRDVSAWVGRLSNDRLGWIAQVDGRPIGFLDLETDGETGFFSYYIAPRYRGHGCGTALLLTLEGRCAAMGLRRAVGYVDPDNRASRAAVRRAGFTVSSEPDADGMLAACKDLTTG